MGSPPRTLIVARCCMNACVGSHVNGERNAILYCGRALEWEQGWQKKKVSRTGPSRRAEPGPTVCRLPGPPRAGLAGVPPGPHSSPPTGLGEISFPAGLSACNISIDSPASPDTETRLLMKFAHHHHPLPSRPNTAQQRQGEKRMLPLLHLPHVDSPSS